MAEKPSDKEEEYFAKKEIEQLRKLQEEKQAQLKASDRKKLQELHHMRCPKCGLQLAEIDFQGVKIDECSECRGIWLDANELQQIISLGSAAVHRLFKILQ